MENSMEFFQFSSVQFSCSIMSDSLWPHGLQHVRPPCSSPTPGVHSNSGPWSRWCHPTISRADTGYKMNLKKKYTALKLNTQYISSLWFLHTSHDKCKFVWCLLKEYPQVETISNIIDLQAGRPEDRPQADCLQELFVNHDWCKILKYL